MRILHVLNHIQRVGNGIVNVAIDLACLQSQAGHEVAVASGGGEYEALLSQYGVQHFQLDQRRSPVNLMQASQRFRSIVHSFQPEIVHTHMMTGVVLAKFVKGKANYGLVATVHNEFQRSADLMGLADRVIAISQAVAISMRSRGIPASKLQVVTNGTLGSPRDRRLSEIEPFPLKRPAISTVAGMYHRKGIAKLIRAFAEVAANLPPGHPLPHLYLVGDGPDRAEFERQASETQVADRIHFEGFQPEPQRYLLATDIFVLASEREPFGLVLSEAREAGCAIVASRVDGIPEVLEGGKAGWLVSPGDVSEWANVLMQLLTQPEQRQAWQQRAQQNLSWLTVERVHQETLDVYQSAIAEIVRTVCA
jgi:glycosyltransferase involved in cell wall biosynthesis